MLSRRLAPRDTPTAVYLLADHLDAVLAAGEDLVACRYEVPIRAGAVDAATLVSDAASLAGYVNRIETFELALLSRTLEARKRAGELRRVDPRFRPIVSLFEGGTALLLDAADELGGASDRRFHSGGCPLAYLRDRAVIAPDKACLGGLDSLTVTDGFRIAGRIELGPLLDLVATFLDTLELHYELFEPDSPGPRLPEPADQEAGGGGVEARPTP